MNFQKKKKYEREYSSFYFSGASKAAKEEAESGECWNVWGLLILSNIQIIDQIYYFASTQIWNIEVIQFKLGGVFSSIPSTQKWQCWETENVTFVQNWFCKVQMFWKAALLCCSENDMWSFLVGWSNNQIRRKLVQIRENITRENEVEYIRRLSTLIVWF